VFVIRHAKCELVIIDESEDSRLEENPARDVLGMPAVFLFRLDGRHSQERRKGIDGVRTALMEARCS
jgi:hypothetical protein